MVDERQSQFTAYQKSCEQVEHILLHWDLARGQLLVPLPEALLMHPDGTSKRQVKTLRQYEKSEVHPLNAHLSSLWIVQIPVSKNAAKSRDKTSASSAEREKAVTIPHIVVHVDAEEHLKVEELLKNTSLPALPQVPLDWFHHRDFSSSLPPPLQLCLHQLADDAGGEPIRPPTPPPTIFSVVPYPKRRDEVAKLTCDCFTFLRPSTPEDQVEKEESAEEARPSASKVQEPTPL